MRWVMAITVALALVLLPSVLWVPTLPCTEAEYSEVWLSLGEQYRRAMKHGPGYPVLITRDGPYYYNDHGQLCRWK